MKKNQNTSERKNMSKELEKNPSKHILIKQLKRMMFTIFATLRPDQNRTESRKWTSGKNEWMWLDLTVEAVVFIRFCFLCFRFLTDYKAFSFVKLRYFSWCLLVHCKKRLIKNWGGCLFFFQAVILL